MTNALVIPIPERSADHWVGVNVAHLLLDRDVSQAQLASRLHVDQSTLSLKLNGKRKWTVTELIALSETFGVSIDDLVKSKPRGPFTDADGETKDYGSHGTVISLDSRRPRTAQPTREHDAIITPIGALA